MGKTLVTIQKLIGRGEIRISDHGYDELAADGLFVDELLGGIAAAELIEDYPHFHKGPCVLVLQHLPDGSPVHAVLGHTAQRNLTSCACYGVSPRPRKMV